MEKIMPQNYVFKLGKYKNMKAVDVARLKTVDKNGKERNTGLSYLEWIIQQDWFRHIDIIKKVIEEVRKEKQGEEAEEGSNTEMEEKIEEIKKKKTKAQPKTVKISTTESDKTLNFQ